MLTTTNLQADLVVYSEKRRDAVIIELTITFETNFKKVQQRKQYRYHEITEAVELNVNLVMLEVGSRGFVHLKGFHQLNAQSYWLHFITHRCIQGCHHRIIYGPAIITNQFHLYLL